MANKIYLQSMTFKSLTGTDDATGFTLYDNYGKTYDNCSESLIKDELELLKYVVESNKSGDDAVITAIIDHLNEEEMGITINDIYYDYNDIKHIIKED